MKPCYLYIIMSIFSLLALPGCRDEEAVQTSEGTRTVTVNLGIAMSRVTEGSSIGDGSTPKDMKVWIFNQDNTKLVDYYEIENPTFSGSDALGELVNTNEHVFELDNTITYLNFYVVLNSDNVKGLSYNLGRESSVDKIKAATFTGLADNLEDNQVPIYGEATSEDALPVEDHKKSYSVTIKTERAVSKLELFFTKESASSDLKIKRITLKNIPDKGLLAREIALTDIANYNKTETLFEDSNGKEITTDLPASESPVGDFSNHPDNFVQINLSQAYLLENPNNNEWKPTTGSDYEYPEAAPPIKNAYVLTVAYTLNNKEEERLFVLPETKRNIWNKIFVRVNDNGELIIQYKALPWQLVESKIGYAPQHIPTDGNPFNVNQDWEESDIAKGNYYALFPQESYNSGRNTTSKLLHHLYDTPQGGDNEARLCILTRPTYDDAIDKEEHWALKAGSAGARYFFILTGPEGATWEAHLTNNEDFSFSTTDENDFKGSEYEKDGNVNKVTHGIARKKPYIIQINANHLYTSYDQNMSGNTIDEPSFDIDGYDKYSSYDESDWESLFSDDYITDWGEEHQKEKVETEFYITVKLTDGTEYELNINPSYQADDDIENKYFPFKEKRRFAGTDTRIWFRHLRAQYGWRNLECLARDLKEDIIEDGEDEAQPWNKADWWTVNPYWNSEHVESVWK